MSDDSPFGMTTPPKPGKSDFKDKESQDEKMGHIASTMRILEDRYGTMRKKLQLTDNALLDAQREFQKERSLLDDEIMECKERITEIEKELKTLKKHVVESVKKNEFRRLRKYVDHWDLQSLLTREEAKKLLSNHKK